MFLFLAGMGDIKTCLSSCSCLYIGALYMTTYMTDNCCKLPKPKATTHTYLEPKSMEWCSFVILNYDI